MIVGIHQPNFLPWLGYFEKIRRSDVFVLLDSVWFSRRSWIHRVRIKSLTGWQWLTVPVHAHTSTTLNLVEIVASKKWKTKLRNIITNYYCHAPLFNELFPEIWSWIEKDWQTLADMNVFIIEEVSRILGITTPLVRSSSLALSGKSNDLNAALVKSLGGTQYLSGDGADGYQNESRFEALGIQVRQLHFQHPVYPQLHQGFEPGLSVLDWLLNVGPDIHWWENSHQAIN